MKTILIKYYEYKKHFSQSLCLHNTGFLNKMQIASNFTKSKTFLKF